MEYGLRIYGNINLEVVSDITKRSDIRKKEIRNFELYLVDMNYRRHRIWVEGYDWEWEPNLKRK